MGRMMIAIMWDYTFVPAYNDIGWLGGLLVILVDWIFLFYTGYDGGVDLRLTLSSWRVQCY